MIRFPHIVRLSPGGYAISKNNSRLFKCVHTIAESGFVTSELYDRVRPSYPKEAVSFLLEKLGILPRDSSLDLQPARILELGAGTGKFTRILRDVLHGSDVKIIASEPLLSMRQEFAKNFPEMEIKDFSAENIDLPDSSMHAVIAAQCFHWFANDKSLSQMQRVLVPGGKLGLIWNSWNHTSPAWVKELVEKVILPCYWETDTPHEMSYEWKEVLDASGRFGPIEGDESQFKSEQEFTFDELFDRVMSISVLQVKTDSEKELIKERIKLIWNKYKENNKLSKVFPHVVKIYWGKKNEFFHDHNCKSSF